MTAPVRNRDMDIFRAIGIICVVMGHYYQPRILYYPVYSFHMALFFFASGYFFKSLKVSEKFKYVFHKIRTLLFPYFVYNLFFAILTYLIFVFIGLKMGVMPNLFNFFVRPFIDGHQYLLFLPAWFVPQLFIVTILFQFIYYNRHDSHILDIIYFLVLLSLTLLCIKWSFAGLKSRMDMFIIRTFFSILFLSIGYFYRKYIEKYDRYIYTLTNLILVIGFTLILKHIFKDIEYELTWAKFHAKAVYVPILTSIFGIYLSLFLSKTLSKFLDDNNFFHKIGLHSFHIMATHIFIFFLINIIIVYVHPDFTIADLSYIFFKVRPELTWPLFVGAGVVLPVVAAEMVKRRTWRVII